MKERREIKRSCSWKQSTIINCFLIFLINERKDFFSFKSRFNHMTIRSHRMLEREREKKDFVQPSPWQPQPHRMYLDTSDEEKIESKRVSRGRNDLSGNLTLCFTSHSLSSFSSNFFPLLPLPFLNQEWKEGWSERERR